MKTYEKREVTHAPYESGAWGADVYDAETGEYLGSVQVDDKSGVPYGYIKPIDKLFVTPSGNLETMLEAFRDPSCIN